MERDREHEIITRICGLTAEAELTIPEAIEVLSKSIGIALAQADFPKEDVDDCLDKIAGAIYKRYKEYMDWKRDNEVRKWAN